MNTPNVSAYVYYNFWVVQTKRLISNIGNGIQKSLVCLSTVKEKKEKHILELTICT